MTAQEISYIYIDGSNLHYGVKALGFHLDYKRFRGWLGQKFGARKVYLFLGLLESNRDRYIQWEKMGYTLIFKEVTIHKTGAVKGNCDAEMVLQVVRDAYESAPHTTILITGDGDFQCLIPFLEEKKCLVKLIVPDERRCSVLLKKTNVPMWQLSEHMHKFGGPIKKEKTPKRDASR